MLLFTNSGETTMSIPSASEILEAAGIDPQEAALRCLCEDGIPAVMLEDVVDCLVDVSVDFARQK
jgi:hypothetical protein